MTLRPAAVSLATGDTDEAVVFCSTPYRRISISSVASHQPLSSFPIALDYVLRMTYLPENSALVTLETCGTGIEQQYAVFVYTSPFDGTRIHLPSLNHDILHVAAHQRHIVIASAHTVHIYRLYRTTSSISSRLLYTIALPFSSLAVDLHVPYVAVHSTCSVTVWRFTAEAIETLNPRSTHITITSSAGPAYTTAPLSSVKRAPRPDSVWHGDVVDGACRVDTDHLPLQWNKVWSARHTGAFALLGNPLCIALAEENRVAILNTKAERIATLLCSGHIESLTESHGFLFACSSDRIHVFPKPQWTETGLAPLLCIASQCPASLAIHEASRRLFFWSTHIHHTVLPALDSLYEEAIVSHPPSFLSYTHALLEPCSSTSIDSLSPARIASIVLRLLELRKTEAAGLFLRQSTALDVEWVLQHVPPPFPVSMLSVIGTKIHCSIETNVNTLLHQLYTSVPDFASFFLEYALEAPYDPQLVLVWAQKRALSHIQSGGETPVPMHDLLLWLCMAVEVGSIAEARLLWEALKEHNTALVTLITQQLDTFRQWNTWYTLIAFIQEESPSFFGLVLRQIHTSYNASLYQTVLNAFSDAPKLCLCFAEDVVLDTIHQPLRHVQHLLQLGPLKAYLFMQYRRGSAMSVSLKEALYPLQPALMEHFTTDVADSALLLCLESIPFTAPYTTSDPLLWILQARSMSQTALAQTLVSLVQEQRMSIQTGLLLVQAEIARLDAWAVLLRVPLDTALGWYIGAEGLFIATYALKIDFKKDPVQRQSTFLQYCSRQAAPQRRASVRALCSTLDAVRLDREPVPRSG